MKLSVQCSCGNFVPVLLSNTTMRFSGMCIECKLWNHLLVEEIKLKPNVFFSQDFTKAKTCKYCDKIWMEKHTCKSQEFHEYLIEQEILKELLV